MILRLPREELFGAQWAERRQMTAATRLYVSPHLDDVVLSVGGLIAEQLRAGDRVITATICSADPPVDLTLSPLALDLHRQWGSANAPYEMRRREDRAACRRLGGAEPRHMGFLDAIYRGKSGCQGSAYETFDQLFAPIPPWDEPFAQTVEIAVTGIIEELRPKTIYGPLGVGANVDHLHVRNAVGRIPNALAVGFYEEQPYSTGRYPVLTHDPVAAAVRACLVPLRPAIQRIHWQTKYHSIQCYESQLTPLFGDNRGGLSILAEYGRALGSNISASERVWYR